MTEPNQNRQTYDHFAGNYHRKRRNEADSLWNRYLDKPMIEKMIGEVDKESMALDLGCGSGHLTGWLKDNGWTVCGSDFSSELIALAKEDHLDLEFSVADMRQTPYADGSFGLVISGLVLHYIEDLNPVYAEVARLLEDQGVFVFTVHHPFDEVTEVEAKGDRFEARMNPYFHGNSYRWTLLDGMELTSYHHTFEVISEGARKNGFVIEQILESRADDQFKQSYPEFYARTNAYPSFCGFKVRKR
ncbi:MAG: class I SAM-dependent methyltransferase [Verrucomicrobiota bacterium]